mmetsp:Transcript_8058/g.17420  ORF Transcript_8058/g.17420 Transcript_8058/m.17420 type:complete len:295 (-) Transcript_8058:83-967(-)
MFPPQQQPTFARGNTLPQSGTMQFAPTQAMQMQQQAVMYQQKGGYDSDDSDDCQAGAFVSQCNLAVKRGFVKKVLGIVGVQLLITVVVGYYVMMAARGDGNFVDGKFYPRPEWWVSTVTTLSMIGSFACILGPVCCCPAVTRKFPANMLILLAFTVFESVLVGVISAKYEPYSVLVVMGITAAVTLTLGLMAATCRIDFTGYSFILFGCLQGMIIASLVMLFFPDTNYPLMHKIFASCGAVLFCGYIVVDIQKLVKPDAQQQFQIDDYWWAAMNIYLDIINLFIYLLQLFGTRE